MTAACRRRRRRRPDHRRRPSRPGHLVGTTGTALLEAIAQCGDTLDVTGAAVAEARRLADERAGAAQSWPAAMHARIAGCTAWHGCEARARRRAGIGTTPRSRLGAQAARAASPDPRSPRNTARLSLAAARHALVSTRQSAMQRRSLNGWRPAAPGCLPGPSPGRASATAGNARTATSSPVVIFRVLFMLPPLVAQPFLGCVGDNAQYLCANSPKKMVRPADLLLGPRNVPEGRG